MTPEEIDVQLAKYKRIGTFFHQIAGFSKIEGKDYVVQMRRLRGEHYGLYFREQNKLQALRNLKAGEARDLTEQEQNEIQRSIEAMRRLLVASIHRIYEFSPDLVIYTPTEKAPGDHLPEQISIDLIEPDYIDLVHKLLVNSGLLVEVSNPELPFPGDRRDDAGTPGPSGEEVRTETEPVSEGVTTGLSA